MSAIFISHSSKDSDVAEEMKLWLTEEGYASLFLDFDPDSGIEAGGKWEHTLYRKLRQCQVLIALLSPHWMDSKWCFAELVQAREQGKLIIPVKVHPCESSMLFQDIQHIDLTDNRDEGYVRLRNCLKAYGLNPQDVFDWDLHRPPYPGLMAFQEDDAAVFFGRTNDIIRCLEKLNRLRYFGRTAPHFALILGASGSGKSSLVRAGLIPRLKKDPLQWLPLSPFRPQSDPFCELATVLADALSICNQPQDWKTICKRLKRAADTTPPDHTVLLTMIKDLLIASNRPNATVLLTIDQAEELFGSIAGESADCFLRLLRSTLEAADQQLITIATMRSDFLSNFQLHPVMLDPSYQQNFAYEIITIDPVALSNFREIIEGPANLAGLHLQDGLVDTMVRDTGAHDALPLLAFTLRRLYERYSDDNLIEIREYNELGGLEGAIRHEADNLLKIAKHSTEELTHLRAAFVPAMVQISAAGDYARRRAYRDELPPEATPLLDHFVNARLLVTDRDITGRDTIEIAHEALLRSWPQLSGWLQEDQDKLRLLESIRRAARDWDDANRQEDLLVHRDGRLADAENILREPRFSLPEGSIERAYFELCQQQQNRRLKTRRKRVRTTIAALSVGVLLLAILASWALVQQTAASHAQTEAEAQRSATLQSQSRALASLSRIEAKDGNGASAVAIALSALPTNIEEPDRPYVLEAEGALYEALLSIREYAVLRANLYGIRDACFSPDGSRVATASYGNTATIYDADSGSKLTTLRGHTDEVRVVVFSPDGTRLLTGSSDKSARLWDASNGDQVAYLHGHKEFLYCAAFSPNGDFILTSSYDGTIRLWDTNTIELLHRFKGQYAAFSPDNTKLVASTDEDTRIYDIKTGRELVAMDGSLSTFNNRFDKVITLVDSIPFLRDAITGKVLKQLYDPEYADLEYGVGPIAFSPDDRFIVTTYIGNTARLWDANNGSKLGVLIGHDFGEEGITDVEFSPDSQHILTSSYDNTARLWNADDNSVAAVFRGHQAPLIRAQFSSDGKRVVTTAYDNTTRLWNVDNPLSMRLVHGRRVTHAAFSPDARFVVTAAEDNVVRLWTVNSGKLIGEFKGHNGPVMHTAFGPDGNQLVSVSADKNGCIWDIASGSAISYLKGHDGVITHVAYSRDGTRIVTASNDNTAKIWSVHNGTLQNTLYGHSDRVVHASFSPDGKKVVTASFDTYARIWNTEDATERNLLKGHGRYVTHAAFSPDGELICTTGLDGTIRLWDANSGLEVNVLHDHENPVEMAAFSPDGKHLVTVSNYESIGRLWEVATGHVISRMQGHSDGIYHASYSRPQGRRIATASSDHTVRLWDAKTGHEVAILRGHEGDVLYTSFSDDGNYLLTIATDNTVRIWKYFNNPQDLIDHARTVVGSLRTESEIDQLTN